MASYPWSGAKRIIATVKSISKSEENKLSPKQKLVEAYIRTRDVTAAGDVIFTSREPNYVTADVVIRLLAQSFSSTNRQRFSDEQFECNVMNSHDEVEGHNL